VISSSDNLVDFRMVECSHISPILDAFSQVFKKSLSKAYYRWKYLSPEGYRSVVMVRKGQVIGHIGLASFSVSFDGLIHSAAMRHSSFVLPEYRGNGLYEALNLFAQNRLRMDGVTFFQSWPNTENLKATLGKSLYDEVFPVSALTLETTGKFVADLTDFNPVSLIDLRYITGLSDMYNDKVIYRINKDMIYFKRRYLDHPEKKFYLHIDDDSYFLFSMNRPGEIIIFEFYFGSNPLDFIKSFKNLFKRRQVVFKVWCSLCANSRAFKYFLKGGFVLRDFNCYSAVKSLDPSYLNRLRFIKDYDFSAGDSDVFG